jgi:hypothetical protein
MPSYSHDEIVGIRWIENEFEQISLEKQIEYVHMWWEEFTFHVQRAGNEKIWGLEFSHAEVQDCANDVEVQMHLRSLLRWMLEHTEPTIVTLYERRALNCES